MSSDLDKKVDQEVAQRIRERRIGIGMTQQALARLIGVAFQQAHKYERGLDRVTAGRLYSIAKALNAPIAYFFPKEETAPPAVPAAPPARGKEVGNAE
jgi:transcriptional regulator with XRE-family HTH domain